VSSLHHNYANPCIDFLADFDLNIMFINCDRADFSSIRFFLLQQLNNELKKLTQEVKCTRCFCSNRPSLTPQKKKN